MNLTHVAGLLLVLLPIAFNVLFFLLQRTFEYPDILRKPTGYILERFNAGGRRLIVTWYLFALSALLLVPVAVLVHQVLAGEAPPYLAVGTTIGVVAGLVQFLGLIRWPFLVPYLARTYSCTKGNSGQSTRDASSLCSRHFIAMRAWRSASISAISARVFGLHSLRWPLTQSASFGRWIGWVGLVPAAGIFVGLFEEAGFKAAGAINAVSYILWSIWLIMVGVAFLLH